MISLRLKNQLKISEREWIPLGTEINNVHTIAGKGAENDIRMAYKLSEIYGGEPSEWMKQVGKIVSDKYEFDIHWYAHDDLGQFDFKIKSYKER